MYSLYDAKQSINCLIVSIFVLRMIFKIILYNTIN